jgi:hypothetical protein
LVIEKMELEDIPQVLEVDRDSYPLPWPASAYRREIAHNRNAHYVVLRRQTENAAKPEDDELEMRPRTFLPPFFRRPHSGDGYEARRGYLTGYAGMWLMLDEAHHHHRRPTGIARSGTGRIAACHSFTWRPASAPQK